MLSVTFWVRITSTRRQLIRERHYLPTPARTKRSVTCSFDTRFEDGRRRHFTEHCLATKATPDPIQSSSPPGTASTAMTPCSDHAVDHRSWRPVPIRVLASGGSMSADWALLRADESIEDLHRFHQRRSVACRHKSQRRWLAPIESSSDPAAACHQHTAADCSSTWSVRSLIRTAITASPIALRAWRFGRRHTIENP